MIYKITVTAFGYERYEKKILISDHKDIVVNLKKKKGKTGKLYGHVYDDLGNSIANAAVYIRKYEIGANTNESVAYEIVDVPYGRFDIECRQIGYQSVVTNKKLSKKSLKVNFTLFRSAVEMEGFRVIDGDEEAYERTGDFPASSIPKESKKEVGTGAEKPKDKHSMFEMDDSSVKAGEDTGKTFPKRVKKQASASGLKAGYVDDNQQYNYFLHFLERFKKQANHYPLSIENRYQINCHDTSGNSLPNCHITVTTTSGEELAHGKTFC